MIVRYSARPEISVGLTSCNGVGHNPTIASDHRIPLYEAILPGACQASGERKRSFLKVRLGSNQITSYYYSQELFPIIPEDHSKKISLPG